MAIEPIDEGMPKIYDVLRGDALEVRKTAYGSVGTVFAGRALEVVWVAKQDEEIEPGWFSQSTHDVLLVVQGQLRIEFADQPTKPITLRPGQLMVLPPGASCRAYRWPRDAAEATVFVAAYEPDPAEAEATSAP
jgi:hypothetical protein